MGTKHLSLPSQHVTFLICSDLQTRLSTFKPDTNLFLAADPVRRTRVFPLGRAEFLPCCRISQIKGDVSVSWWTNCALRNGGYVVYQELLSSASRELTITQKPFQPWLTEWKCMAKGLRGYNPSTDVAFFIFPLKTTNILSTNVGHRDARLNYPASFESPFPHVHHTLNPSACLINVNWRYTNHDVHYDHPLVHGFKVIKDSMQQMMWKYSGYRTRTRAWIKLTYSTCPSCVMLWEGGLLTPL